MSINHQIERATAAFIERRRGWQAYSAYSLEALELLQQENLPMAEKAALQEYLLHRKRALKAKLEIVEKRADYLERGALPVAVTAFSMVTWLLIELQVAAPWRQGVQIVAFLVCALGWAYIRDTAYRRAVAARKSLVKLGRVD